MYGSSDEETVYLKQKKLAIDDDKWKRNKYNMIELMNVRSKKGMVYLRRRDRGQCG